MANILQITVRQTITTRRAVRQFIDDDIKETSKLRITDLLWEVSTSDRYIPPKEPVLQKSSIRLHVIMKDWTLDISRSSLLNIPTREWPMEYFSGFVLWLIRLYIQRCAISHRDISSCYFTQRSVTEYCKICEHGKHRQHSSSKGCQYKDYRTSFKWLILFNISYGHLSNMLFARVPRQLPSPHTH